MSQTGTALSAARFAMGPTPVGAAGLVISAAMGNKGKKNPFIPGYSNGQYTINDKPWERANSKNYQLQGDTGKFDLLPTIGKTNNQYMKAFTNSTRDISGGTPSPNAEQMLYNNMRESVVNDPAALAQFDSMYKPKNVKMPLGWDNVSKQQQSLISRIDPSADPALAYRGMFNKSNGMNPFHNTLTGVTDAVDRDIGIIGTFAKNRPTFTQRLSQALRGPSPAYQAPQGTYQAPQGTYQAPQGTYQAPGSPQPQQSQSQPSGMPAALQNTLGRALMGAANVVQPLNRQQPPK